MQYPPVYLVLAPDMFELDNVLSTAGEGSRVLRAYDTIMHTPGLKRLRSISTLTKHDTIGHIRNVFDGLSREALEDHVIIVFLTRSWSFYGESLAYSSSRVYTFHLAECMGDKSFRWRAHHLRQASKYSVLEMIALHAPELIEYGRAQYKEELDAIEAQRLKALHWFYRCAEHGCRPHVPTARSLRPAHVQLERCRIRCAA